MTLPASERRSGPYIGNDAQTVFPFDFTVADDDELIVTFADADGIESVLVLDSDYSVKRNTDQDVSPGGSITYPLFGPDNLSPSQRLVIEGNTPYDQPLDIPDGGSFRPDALERELDRIVTQIQQVRVALNRAVRLGATASNDVSAVLPRPQANSLLKWDAQERSLENLPLDAIGAIVAFGEAVTDTFTTDGIVDDFDLSANPGNINNLDISLDGVTQVAGDDFGWDGSKRVTFAIPPAAGRLAVRYVKAVPSGAGSAAAVSASGGPWGTVQAFINYLVSSSGAGSVGYRHSGSGAASTNIAAYLNGGIVHAAAYGIKGDGTDETSLIQTFINAHKGRTLYFPGTEAGYKISAVELWEGTSLLGDSSGGTSGSEPSTTFHGTPGADAFTFNGGAFPGNYRIENVNVVGGRRAFSSLEDKYLIGAKFINVHAGQQTDASLYCGLGWEQVSFEKCWLGFGSRYAIRSRDAALAEGNYMIFWADQCRFVGSDSAFLLEHSLSSLGTVVQNSAFQTTGKDAIIINAPVQDWLFDNVTTEFTGHDQYATSVFTTGSTSAGTPNLTLSVLNPWGGPSIQNGDTIVVEGARLGPFGEDNLDLVTTVVSGGGTVNLVMAVNADYTLTNKEVTNAKYSFMKLGNPSGYGLPSIRIRNCNLAQVVPGNGAARYSIDTQGQARVSLHDVVLARPVNDPNATSSMSGTVTGGPFRVRSDYKNYVNWGQQETAGTALPSAFQRPAIKPGQPGFGYQVNLVGDSSDGLSGNFGKFLIVKTTFGGSTLIEVDGDTDRITVAAELAHAGAAAGFFNKAPVARPTALATSGGFTANTGTAMNSASTSTGGSGATAYTFGDLVLALKSLGLIAP